MHNNICFSELARMCGMSYISQLGSVKNTPLAARNLILQMILTARSTIKKIQTPTRPLCYTVALAKCPKC